MIPSNLITRDEFMAFFRNEESINTLTQIAAIHSEASVFEGSSFFPVRVCVLQIFV